MTSSINQAAMPPNDDQQTQYRSLCIILQAVNETSKARSAVKYASGDTCSDASLSDYQKFLCKLAQICDSTKGGDTITALVALKGSQGPDYLFISNARKQLDLERTKAFLSDLIHYVGNNPEKLADKALQKRVMGRIFEFNFSRLDGYLKGLISSLEFCINYCQNAQQGSESDTITQLRTIESRAKFPRDMVSTDAKHKFFRDCEDLIKAIQNSKNTIDGSINRHVGDGRSESSYHWCQLRHFLGRLHSYRQASEIIVKASKEWTGLFKGFTVSYICSSRPKKFSLPRTPYSSSRDLIKAAFPNYDLSYYETDIVELQKYDLDAEISRQVQEMPSKTQVHCEVHLHHHLVKQGKTQPHDFWNDTMFIATSKPTCRLCHYYFQDYENEFQVQPPHMNLYPKWRLPDIEDSKDNVAIERHEELMDDILEKMRVDTLKILQVKLPQGKRNDSRTDSRNWPVREDINSRGSTLEHQMYNPSPVTTEDDFVDMANMYRGIAV